MKTLYEIIKSLENTQGNIAKQAILDENKGNEVLKEFVRMTLDPAINFFIKKIPAHAYEGERHEFHFDILGGMLYHLAERNITGRQAERWLGNLYAAATEESKYLIKCLIDRKIGKSNVGDTMALKTWPGLFFIPGYMRCSLMTPKIKNHFESLEEIIVQMKADGSFCYLKQGAEQSAFTRAGSHYPEWLAEHLLSGSPKGEYVFVGELLVSKNNQLLDRATGNGIYNSILKGGEQEEYDGYRFFMEAWDVLPTADFEAGLCEITYKARYDKLKEYTRHTHSIGVIDTHIVPTLEDAYKIYSQYTSEGYEGAVIKDGSSIWKDHTSSYNVKLKIKFECDLKIVGVVEGTGKAAGMTGALQLASSDGLLLTDCGTGFSDVVRKEFWNHREQKIGKIVTVSANDVITNRNNSTKSLFLPAFEEERLDKTEADSLDRVVAQLEAAKRGGV